MAIVNPGPHSASDHYPRFTTVRPAVSGFRGGGRKLFEATRWGYIDQANPATSFIGNPAGLTAFIDANNSYDGTAVKRIMIEFEDGLDIGVTDYEIMPWVESYPPDATIRYSFDWLGNHATGGYNDTVGTQGFLRIRPIIAPYDMTGLTWNDFIANPPSFETAIIRLFGSSTLLHIADIVNPSDALTVFGTFTGDSQGGIIKLRQPGFTSGYILYGLVIDLLANCGDIVDFTISDVQCTLDAAVPTAYETGFGTPRIYAAKMEAN